MQNTQHNRTQSGEPQKSRWPSAAGAKSGTPLSSQSADAIINQLIHIATVALSAIEQNDISNARAMALAHPKARHPRSYGATLFGLSNNIKVSVEWAAWANTLAAGAEVECDNTDLIPALLAVAQHSGCEGAALLQSTCTAIETRQMMTEAAGLPAEQAVSYQAPALAAGIGQLMQLPAATVRQAMYQASQIKLITHASNYPSEWRRYVVAQTAKTTIEIVDRCMRGDNLLPVAQEVEPQTTMQFSTTACAAVDITASSRDNSIQQFMSRTENLLSPHEQQRFLSLVQRLNSLSHKELLTLNPQADIAAIPGSDVDGRGIF